MLSSPELGKSTPRYSSQNKRLLAIADAYCEVKGVTAFTTDEVSKWAIDKGLVPCPKRGCTPATAIAWEEKLAAVVASERRPGKPKV